MICQYDKKKIVKQLIKQYEHYIAFYFFEIKVKSWEEKNVVLQCNNRRRKPLLKDCFLIFQYQLLPYRGGLEVRSFVRLYK